MKLTDKKQQNRDLAIEIGTEMGWDIPEDVQFSCDSCIHLGVCHHGFDPCNMILTDKKFTCLSSSMNCEWSYMQWKALKICSKCKKETDILYDGEVQDGEKQPEQLCEKCYAGTFIDAEPEASWVQYIVTEDIIEDGLENGRMGLFGGHVKLTEDEIKQHPNSARFQIYDDDGELYYKGYVTGSDDMVGTEEYCFSPLDNFGRGAGCTGIKLYNKETRRMEWV